MDCDNLTGRMVCSTAGRDMNKYFIVIGIFNEEYVYISDGELRKIEKPKKKKLKHLSVTDTTSEEIRELLLSSKKVSNKQIKKFLQSKCINKEV